MIVPGEGFCSLQVVSRGFVPGGMVIDEIDTCIKHMNAKCFFPVPLCTDMKAAIIVM